LLLSKAPRYGTRRLKQMLQAKSLDADLVNHTLARARDSELDRARSVWQRRFGTPPSDLRERARQQRFLAARGFEASVIERVLKDAARADDDQTFTRSADTDEH
jgi:regulatory protein